MESNYRKAPSNYNDWVQDRIDNPSIGASMSASILGFNPYQSAVDIWEQLVFKNHEKEDNLAMYLGREMEPIVKKLFMDRTGLKVVADNKIRIDKEFDYLTTNLDGVVVGEQIPVEYKTTAKPWSGEIPDNYFVQLQHQMMVTNAPSVYFCSLSMGFQKQLVVEKYDRNDDFIGSMRDELINFWETNVLKEIPPQIKTLEDAKKIYTDVDKNSILTADDSLQVHVSELRAMQVSKKDLEKRMNDKKIELMKSIGNFETLVDHLGEVIVSWKKSNPTEVFDKKKFQEENPDIYNKYLINKQGSRRFIVKPSEVYNKGDK